MAMHVMSESASIQALLGDIFSYVEYLRTKLKLQLTLHRMERYMFTYAERALPYNVHDNPFCVFLKQNQALWSECVQRQEKTIARAQSGPFFGTCWLGMGEYVFPLRKEDGAVVGFVSVSGYQGDPEKRARQFDKVCCQYHFDRNALEGLYEHAVRRQRPALEELRVIVQPLCNQFTLLFSRLEGAELRLKLSEGNNEVLFTNVKRYLERRSYESVSIEQLAKHFSCSTSHMSRVIKEHAHCNYRKFINASKVGTAKIFLETTRLSIQEITYMLGYADSNYFSTVFRREAGVSPRQWRKDKREEHAP